MNTNYSNRLSLVNKVVLVTGAAGLLGYEHAMAVLSVGGTVVLTDVNFPQLENLRARLLEGNQECSSRLKIIKMDVSDPFSVDQAAIEIKKSLKRVDVLINNAAIDPKVQSSSLNLTRLENFSLDQWNLELSVGLTGAFLCTKVFGTLMAVDGLGGNIINICSDLSVIAPDQRLYEIDGLPHNLQSVKPATYSVIKHGLVGFTKYVATYWRSEGVRCNCLSPGGIFVNQNSNFVDKISKRIPMGRMAHSYEYREAIIFLASEASSYMNGHNLVIDGGRSIW
jgi:NAD(P)-dependent dehydrogenase (short-subunit alcohol dehydrogenase family)